MERRRYLALLSTALLAGCNQSESTGAGATPSQATSEPTSTPTPSSTPTSTPEVETTAQTQTPNQDVAESLDQASENINQAARLINEEAESLNFLRGETSVSTNAVDAALSNARDELDAAESMATGSQADRVALHRNWVDYLDRLASAMALIDEGGDDFSTAVSYENTSRYEDAADSVEEAASTLEEAQTILDDAASILSDIDSQTPASAEIDLAQMQTAQENLSAVVEAYRRYCNSAVAHDRGLADYGPAAEAYNEGDYTAAERGYSDARDHFATAEERYSSAESEVTQRFVPLFISQTCTVRAYRDAAELMASASREAQQGNNSEAEDLVADANDALERDCSA